MDEVGSHSSQSTNNKRVTHKNKEDNPQAPDKSEPKVASKRNKDKNSKAGTKNLSSNANSKTIIKKQNKHDSESQKPK